MQKADTTSENPVYRVALAVSDVTNLPQWIGLALSLGRGNPPSTTPEISLRGLLTMPEGVSLSEGVTQTQQMRDTLDKAILEAATLRDAIHDETKVYVDYRPLARLIDDLNAVDLLILQWAGPQNPTGGMTTDDILRLTPCDVVLVCGESWNQAGPVLLSLRGGPNISLGLNVAKALAAESTITLFHAVDKTDSAPDLGRLFATDPHITRAVTALNGFTDGILRESVGHKAVVLGATFRQPEWASSTANPIIKTLYERSQIPLVMVRAYQPGNFIFGVPHPRPYRPEDLSTRVDRWFAENTYHSHAFADLEALLALKQKQGVTISLGLPALNEAATVGHVIQTVKTALMDEIPLLDEIVLIDSVSEDDTIAIAESLGVPTYKHPEILAAEVGTNRGKGEALWKSLHVLKGDIICWIDTDITNIHPRFVYGLIGPLLKNADVQYVKGFYERPIKVGEEMQASGGGRVTELVARPLLNLFYPELSGIIQPLSGEYAGRRAALEAVPFFSGYGVETGLLLDLHERFGLKGIAQVDLEERIHHNQPLASLSKMSFAIHQVFIARLEKRYGVQLLNRANRSMKMIVHEPERFALEIAEIGDAERPPMNSVPVYLNRQQNQAAK